MAAQLISNVFLCVEGTFLNTWHYVSQRSTTVGAGYGRNEKFDTYWRKSEIWWKDDMTYLMSISVTYSVKDLRESGQVSECAARLRVDHPFSSSGSWREERKKTTRATVVRSFVKSFGCLLSCPSVWKDILACLLTAIRVDSVLVFQYQFTDSALVLFWLNFESQTNYQAVNLMTVTELQWRTKWFRI